MPFQASISIMIKNNGFSLLELLVALVIVGLLAGIAYPSYQQHVQKSRRHQAELNLLSLQNKTTIWQIHHNEAQSFKLSDIDPELAKMDLPYQYSITKSEAGLVFKATPQYAQAEDHCGSLILHSDGQKDANGHHCWQR